MDVASQYTAYMKDKQNEQPGHQVTRWKKRVENRKNRVKQNMAWPEVSDADISMDDTINNRSLMYDGFVVSEIKPHGNNQYYPPPSQLKIRNNSINSQENQSIDVYTERK